MNRNVILLTQFALVYLLTNFVQLYIFIFIHHKVANKKENNDK